MDTTNNNSFFASGAFKTGFLALCIAVGLAILISAVRGDDSRGMGIDQVPHITVSGFGEIEAVPDVAVFTFDIRKEAKVQADSQKMVTDVLNPLIQKIKDAGIEEKDIKTLGYNTYPVYDQQVYRACTSAYCPPSNPVIRGYETSVTVEVKVRENDNTKAGEIVSLVTTGGATTVGGIQFTIDDEQAVLDQAREAAIADAREKAEALADDLGVRLGRIVNFTEDSSPSYFYGRGGAMMDVANQTKEATPELPQGQNKFESRVTVWYEIR
ncbi:MAG TPA: SIMPL domain-containing protein [Candidatus Paceibacterota bacterium]|nr:SIMPL domain-containing protein [Candidatus Paceibacterota bacterium]